AGWQGACSGTGDCNVTMDADRDVTASFSTSSPPPGTGHFTVVFTGKGSGRVTSSPAAVDCPGTCTMTAPSGSSVSINAVPDASSTFVGWGGACSGAGGCSVTANGDQTVWVNFEPKAPPVSSCAGITAPDAVTMQQFVHQRERYNFDCLSGLGDANGTLSFPTRFHDSSAHGSRVDFVTTANVFLRDQSDSSEGPRPIQQPNGLAVWGDGGHMNPVQDQILVKAWDSSGNPIADAVFRARNLVSAGDRAGGVLFAGDVSFAPSGPYVHAAVMFTGGGSAPRVRWGPKALASAGTVF